MKKNEFWLKRYLLKRDFMGVEAGRIFKEAKDGSYFHSMADDEHLEGRHKELKPSKEMVENNPDCFSEWGEPQYYWEEVS